MPGDKGDLAMATYLTNAFTGLGILSVLLCALVVLVLLRWWFYPPAALPRESWSRILGEPALYEVEQKCRKIWNCIRIFTENDMTYGVFESDDERERFWEVVDPEKVRVGAAVTFRLLGYGERPPRLGAGWMGRATTVKSVAW